MSHFLNFPYTPKRFQKSALGVSVSLWTQQGWQGIILNTVYLWNISALIRPSYNTTETKVTETEHR